MNVPAWGWFLTIGLMTAFLLVDVFVIARRPHVPSMAEAGRHLAFYVGAAVLFGLFVWLEWGGQYAGEFYAGWLTEYSLSVDNLFVFLLIMASFKVPQKLQQSALMIGIVIAIVLRGAFIGLGAVVINAYSWVFYIFGAFLVYTAVKLASGGESDDDEYHENRFMLWVERRFPATKQWNGVHLTVVEKGKRLVTPMFIVILALGTTDLLFALDSIPAIYGLTKEPFLVLTANIFALMGLRQLYFLIGGLLKRLVYLSIGLAVLLAFIGVKLFMHALHENNLPFVNGGQKFDGIPDIPISVSLGVIVLILGVTTVASLWKSRRDASAQASLAAAGESDTSSRDDGQDDGTDGDGATAVEVDGKGAEGDRGHGDGADVHGAREGDGTAAGGAGVDGAARDDGGEVDDGLEVDHGGEVDHGLEVDHGGEVGDSGPGGGPGREQVSARGGRPASR